MRKQPDTKEQCTCYFNDDRSDAGISGKCAVKSVLISFIVIHIQLPQTNFQVQFSRIFLVGGSG